MDYTIHTIYDDQISIPCFMKALTDGKIMRKRRDPSSFH